MCDVEAHRLPELNQTIAGHEVDAVYILRITDHRLNTTPTKEAQRLKEILSP